MGCVRSSSPDWGRAGRVGGEGLFLFKTASVSQVFAVLEGDSASTSCPELAASGEKDDPALGRLEGLLQPRRESRAPMVGITLASAQKHACGSTNGSPVCVLILRGYHYAKLFFRI